MMLLQCVLFSDALDVAHVYHGIIKEDALEGDEVELDVPLHIKEKSTLKGRHNRKQQICEVYSWPSHRAPAYSGVLGHIRRVVQRCLEDFSVWMTQRDERDWEQWGRQGSCWGEFKWGWQNIECFDVFILPELGLRRYLVFVEISEFLFYVDAVYLWGDARTHTHEKPVSNKWTLNRPIDVEVWMHSLSGCEAHSLNNAECIDTSYPVMIRVHSWWLLRNNWFINGPHSQCLLVSWAYSMKVSVNFFIHAKSRSRYFL